MRLRRLLLPLLLVALLGSAGVGYLMVTGFTTARTQDALLSELESEAAPRPDVPSQARRAGPVASFVAVGDPLAVLEIPRFGDDWKWAMVEGTEESQLDRGPGHYPGTPLPGDAGNVGVAGHRAGHGSPVHRLRRAGGRRHGADPPGRRHLGLSVDHPPGDHRERRGQPREEFTRQSRSFSSWNQTTARRRGNDFVLSAERIHAALLRSGSRRAPSRRRGSFDDVSQIHTGALACNRTNRAYCLLKMERKPRHLPHFRSRPQDDDDIAMLVMGTLRRAGFETTHAATATSGVEAALELRPELITLDLELPDFDGVEVCRRVRQHSDCYIVMITGRDDEIDLLVGLGVGADDFIAKPFSPRELQARIASLFRRPRMATPSVEADAAASSATQGPIDGGAGLLIDAPARQVRVNDVEVDLTRTEFELLVLLAARAGIVCDRSTLVKQVWDGQVGDDGHLINVHIGNLRRKLRQHAPTEWIRTVRGVGYRFDPAS